MDWRATRNLELYRNHTQYPQNPRGRAASLYRTHAQNTQNADARVESGIFEDIEYAPLKVPCRVPPPTGAQPTPEATVTATPMTWPQRSSRPFLVAIDGSTCCPACGQAGRIPHHLSLIFWKFWTRDRFAALVEALRPDERLAWLGKGLVRVEGADGQSRELRQVGGRWNEVPK
jgi:hypothetical protein